MLALLNISVELDGCRDGEHWIWVWLDAKDLLDLVREQAPLRPEGSRVADVLAMEALVDSLLMANFYLVVLIENTLPSYMAPSN